jgi:hypothetical protein
MQNLMSALPVIGAERVVYYREQGAASYNVYAYGFALAIVELPYIAGQARGGGRGEDRPRRRARARACDRWGTVPALPHLNALEPAHLLEPAQAPLKPAHPIGNAPP